MMNAATKSGTWARAAALIGLAGLANAAAAQTPGFWRVLPPGPTNNITTLALSGDGRVAGGTWANPQRQGFLWTRETGSVGVPAGPQGHPEFTIRGLSGDGAVYVGQSGTVNGVRGYRRRASGEYDIMGVLPGDRTSDAIAVSRDGETVVGNSLFQANGPERSNAFRWTLSGGMQPLGTARPWHDQSRAYGVSADGRTVVGYSTDGFSSSGLVWREGQGTSALPGGGQFPQAESVTARGVSGDGRWIVGEVGSRGAARWNPDGGYTLLSTDPAWRRAQAISVSDDGSVVAGLVGPLGTPFIWREGAGIQLLSDYLVSAGVQLPSGYQTTYFRSMSADGRTFMGEGYLPGDTITTGWVATVPTPGAAAVLGLAGVLAARRRRR